MPEQYLSNPALKTIKPGWQGNPVEKGRFLNLGEQFDPSFGLVLRWMLSANPQRQEKKNDKWLPNIHKENPSLAAGDNFIAWLGHATFFIRLNGISIITDPVFFNASVVKRLVGNACDPMQLQGINYILLSHDHRDHCDEKSLKLLRKNSDFQLLTGLMMQPLVKSWLRGTPIQEAGWYQEYTLENESLKITFLPAYHWSRRGMTDIKKRLWGSFMIQAGGKTIYFAADSALKPHFKEIGELFPRIDMALIGIGAYKPPFIMQQSHTSPEEAIQAFRDTGADRLIPMHYGTFDLSDEPIGEPYRKMLDFQAQPEFMARIVLPDIGEKIRL